MIIFTFYAPTVDLLLLNLFIYPRFIIHKHRDKKLAFKLLSSSYNWLSLAGATIALISLFMIIFLFSISTIFSAGNSYLGLVV
jgi:hypothetical protein